MAELQPRNREKEKLILKLYNSGQTYQEIADELDITKGRVGQIYRRKMKEMGIRIYKFNRRHK